MSVDQLNRLFKKIQQRKNQLISEIEKEVKFLNDHHMEVDINLKQLRHNSSFITGDESQYLKLRDQLAELDFIDKVQPLLEQIPVSNGSTYYNKINVDIGIIADEFLYNSFKGIANFHYVERDQYTHLKGKLDVLLIASTWKGIKGDWKGMGNPKIKEIRRSIFDMIEFFRKDGVKIVFYSKEDPTNYNFFVDIAQQCDYIFTTAAEKVEDYKRDCNNERVYVLEFGVNPIYNNPIGIKPVSEIDGALFAGSWYKKYPHRQKDSRILFDGVIEADKGLKIIDRNFHLKLERHFYPTEYLSYISPSVQHESLQPLLKLYQWVINLNSVKYSETMFANRVYEIQAMGSLLLSNYSLGINNTFPNIFLAFDKTEIKHIMQNVSDLELYRHRLFGIRQVLRNHTTYHRINYLLNQIGYENQFLPEKTVAVIVEQDDLELRAAFQRQSYSNKVLLTIEQARSTSDHFDYVTFFAPGNYYGEYYLEDMVNAFKYTAASYVTKDSYFDGNTKVEGVENNYVNQIKSKYRTVFSLETYTMEQLLFGEQLDGENGYSCDSLEYNVQPTPITYTTKKDKKFTVIIPVYNNGQHLYGKCFMSLRRSSMFDEMEILIIDDGSTDQETLMIIDRLERFYDNISVYKYCDGGSGSASRPRNKGIELASTDYVTFLDPDNEAVNDGYAKLYRILVDEQYDMAVGNMLKVDTAEHEFNYYRDVAYYQGKVEFTDLDAKDYLDSTFFKAQSIQALMVKKTIIQEHNLEMVLGAVGQDTLYFHELVVHVNSLKIVNDIIHIYYAGVNGSTVNNITKKTFEKYVTLEKSRLDFLKKHNLLNIYMDKRFNYYFVNWYFKKLDLVNEEDFIPAVTQLNEIYEMYKNVRPKMVDAEIEQRMKVLKKQLQ